MINKPFISFIVPCYNQAEFLNESLTTVLQQTYNDWECIIVNDGSTDDTKQVALQWTQKDIRFKYLEKENGGLSSARNAGIKVSKSNYIFPFDADDKLEVTYLEKAVEVLKSDSEIEVLSCRVQLFGVKNSEFVLPDYSFKTLLLRNCFIACSIIKKETYNRVGGYDENLTSFEDWEFWISALKDGGKTHRINEILYYYRKHEEHSLSNKFSKVEGYYNSLYDYIYEKHFNLYKSHFPNFIFVYQDYMYLKAFNDKVRNTYIFKCYAKLKKIMS